MSGRTVAIMQPTYLPWLGYFDLIDQADCFVFLDSVQFSKRSWQQRNRVKASDRIVWLRVPVLTKGRFTQAISEVEIDRDRGFPNKHVKTIAALYGRAPFFGRYIDELSGILQRPHRLLADLNVELIGWFCAHLGIDTPTVRSSSMEVNGRRAERLANICRSLGADSYIATEGARTYIEEDNALAAQGIQVTYHSYSHPVYRQLHGEFTPYLSALDLLLNEGPSSFAVIREGRQDKCVATTDHER